MNNFLLSFNFAGYHELDKFALDTHQTDKLGNKENWFGCFRDGLFGFYNRIYGVQKHYFDVHAWRLNSLNSNEYEYHLTAIFFHMDSAIECFTFALNALGYGVSPQDFKDITNPKFPEGLKGISPLNIYRDDDKKGYTKYFPSLKSYWQSKEKLLGIIRDQHDVSKHRGTIFKGGQCRNDPPPGFYESLGIANDPIKQSFYSPMAEILLDPTPKKPTCNHQIVNDCKLEPIAEEFCEFINISGQKAYEDAGTHIIS